MSSEDQSSKARFEEDLIAVRRRAISLKRKRNFKIRLICFWVPVLALLFLGGCYMMAMPGHSHVGPLLPMTEAEIQLSGALRSQVEKIASEIGIRCLQRLSALRATEGYLEQSFREMGYEPMIQEYQARGVTVRNLSVEIRGQNHPERIFVVGAHYDSTSYTPGANDNGSGVAVLLELARLFAGKKPACTVRFVAFVNEEPPYFHTEEMGSLVYARACKARDEKIVGMWALETMGCYSDEPGSQHYPFPFSLFYPTTGNFILFLGDLSSRSLVRESVGAFREAAHFPSEGGALSSAITGVGWSDHWSFWQVGYPGLMVTDTAPFRFGHYHKESDTLDKIDFDRLARVTKGIEGTLLKSLNAE